MEGRWESAPPELLQNLKKFENSLESIRDFMEHEASASWGSRLMRKGSIEESLRQYNIALNDAARSFQVSTLIEIQYSLHQIANANNSASPLQDQKAVSPIEVTAETILLDDKTSSFGSSTLIVENEESVPTTELESDSSTTPPQGIDPTTLSNESKAIADDVTTFDLPLSIPRYHQSQVRPRPRSSRLKDGLLAGAMEVVLPNGESAWMQRYDGADRKMRWQDDIRKALPDGLSGYSLVGISEQRAPFPFLLFGTTFSE